MNKHVLRLTLINTTPLLVGWYEPHIQDPMGIRATEIKGLWRWWCRAFIAGAMFDQEMLCGRPGDHVLLIPKPEEIKAISCLVGKVLGLGYVSKHEATASRFKLYTDIENGVTITKFKDRRQRNKYQRIILLSLGQEVEGIDIGHGHKFILTVEKVKSKYEDAEDLALKILIASLQLSGIGKGGRRGLGSLDIVSMNSEMISINIRTRDIKNFIDEIYKSAIEIINKYAKECKTQVCNENASGALLPPLPAISKTKVDDIGIFSLLRIDTKTTDFKYIHNFFVRSERCRQLRGKPDCKDDLRVNLSAWFLGLPREQKNTGYKVKSSSISRRASPIILAYHSSKENIFGQGVLVNIFLSGDWPRELEWTGGGGSQPININFNEIIQAYKIFIKEFENYLSRRGLKYVHLWP